MSDFAPGYRIESHPATDLFAQGVRYGDVRRVTKTRVHVKFDRLGAVVAVRPEDLVFVDYPERTGR